MIFTHQISKKKKTTKKTHPSSAGGNAQERVSLYAAGEKVCPTERLKQLNLA